MLHLRIHRIGNQLLLPLLQRLMKCDKGGTLSLLFLLLPAKISLLSSSSCLSLHSRFFIIPLLDPSLFPLLSRPWVLSLLRFEVRVGSRPQVLSTLLSPVSPTAPPSRPWSYGYNLEIPCLASECIHCILRPTLSARPFCPTP